MRYIFETARFYITPQGKIEEIQIHSGISPKNAQILAKVHVLYKTYEEAKEVLEEYNKAFTTFKGLS